MYIAYNESMPKSASKLNRQSIVVLVVLVLLLYVVVPQLGDFSSSWGLLKNVDWIWASAGLICVLGTYLAGAMTYRLLAFKRLVYAEVLLMQLVAMFVNRLLPAGIGAVGTNFVYLRNRRHTAAQAGSVITVNNMLGFLGHSLLLLVVAAVSAGGSSGLRESDLSQNYYVPILIVAVSVALTALALVFGKGKFKASVQDVAKQLGSYRHRPLTLLAALGSSTSLTLANVLCLTACAVALNVELPFVVILLVFTFGVGAGTATPTPGGLGGFEAGLVAGFIAYGVDPAAALAVALLFRFISYWLPLLPGGVAFLVVQKRQLLKL